MKTSSQERICIPYLSLDHLDIFLLGRISSSLKSKLEPDPYPVSFRCGIRRHSLKSKKKFGRNSKETSAHKIGLHEN